MDFSPQVLRPPTSSTISNDTMDHAQMVQACRFGWSAGPANGQPPSNSQSVPLPSRSVSSSNGFRRTRFLNCRGRLYHQLTCGHRIRTDIVEDCGSNCLEFYENVSQPPFYCHECFEKEANQIWLEREAEHRATYPSVAQMSKEQYEQWYEEHRQLQVVYAQDRRKYELELQATTRSSNMCLALEMSKEEMDFAAELDSLSLAMIPSNDTVVSDTQPRERRSLPSDASEQLHWGLKALDLERGSCGIEYTLQQPTNHHPRTGAVDEEDLWMRSRTRN